MVLSWFRLTDRLSHRVLVKSEGRWNSSRGGESTETGVDEERIMGWTCCSESLDAAQLNTCLAWMSFNKTWTGVWTLWTLVPAALSQNQHLIAFSTGSQPPTEVQGLLGLVIFLLHPSVIHRKIFSIRLAVKYFKMDFYFFFSLRINILAA